MTLTLLPAVDVAGGQAVRLVQVHGKLKRNRGYAGYRADWKKAYVKLKPGQKSIEYFERAIALDPTHAESYAGLAEALCYAGIYGLRPSSETYPEARTLALKALDLDAL